MFSPATRYALWAAGGACAGVIADTRPSPEFLANLATGDMPGAQYITNSTVLAAITIGVAQFVLKGDNKRNLTAAGVGMLIPTAAKATAKMALEWGNGNDTGGAYGRLSNARARRQLSAPAMAAHSNPYLTASRGLNVA